MGKLKGGKKLSKVGSKFLTQLQKPYNPFEEKINKEKQQIFGRPNKNIKGTPGVSRSQACNKRKNTLLYEYEQQHKTNSISDRRIGEKNRFISQEEKTVARYAAVRAKHKSKQLYNLESAEVLTHNGITLNEIEKFEDPRSEDEDSDCGNGGINGRLDKQFVGEAHFGGGVLSRKSNNTNSEATKSYKDIIHQLIVDSKKRKVEKQLEKECTQELTDKLDSEWKDLLPLMSKLNKTLQQEEPATDTSTLDKYDKYVSELRFETCGVPSDKLKTTAEITAEEAKTRETLEQERFRRMQGPCFKNPTPVHRSADDLDDNCFSTFTTTLVDEEVDMLRYNEDGELLNGTTVSNDLEDQDNNILEEEQMTPDEEVEEDESSEDEQDHFSDLESDDDSDIGSNAENTNEVVLNKSKLSIQAQLTVAPITSNSFPKTYEDFKQTFNILSHTEYNLKLSSLIQYAKTTPNRKDIVNFLLTSALRYMHDCNLQDPLIRCYSLLPAVYDMIQIDPESSCNTFIERLRELRTQYAVQKYVSVGILLWFKVAVSVFSVSDFRHAVATPALVVLEEMLNKAALRVMTERDVVGGLMLAALMLEFTWISKRFSPALAQFLTSIVSCAATQNNKTHRNSKLSPNLLFLTSNNNSKSSFPLQLNLSYLTEQRTKNTTTDDDFKITSLYVAAKLLQASYSQLTDAGLASRCEVFAPIMEALKGIRASIYPQKVREEIQMFVMMVSEDMASRKLEYLSVEKKRPKPMRLYEPNIQTIYDRRHRGPKGDKTERDKLMYKLKQERKGALREIRKDVAFLGRHRIRHQIKSDIERKAQVKKIFSEAAIQQSDLNSLKRKKNS